MLTHTLSAYICWWAASFFVVFSLPAGADQGTLSRAAAPHSGENTAVNDIASIAKTAEKAVVEIEQAQTNTDIAAIANAAGKAVEDTGRVAPQSHEAAAHVRKSEDKNKCKVRQSWSSIPSLECMLQSLDHWLERVVQLACTPIVGNCGSAACVGLACYLTSWIPELVDSGSVMRAGNHILRWLMTLGVDFMVLNAVEASPHGGIWVAIFLAFINASQAAYYAFISDGLGEEIRKIKGSCCLQVCAKRLLREEFNNAAQDSSSSSSDDEHEKAVKSKKKKEKKTKLEKSLRTYPAKDADGAVKEGRLQCKHTPDDVYQDPEQTCCVILSVFVSQCALILFYMCSLFEEHVLDPALKDRKNYTYWLTGVFLQMAVLFGRGGDSVLGRYWYREFWGALFRCDNLQVVPKKVEGDKEVEVGKRGPFPGTPFRAFISWIVNGLMRDVIAFTLPILLRASDNGLDFAKDCLAVVFVTKLDDLNNPDPVFLEFDANLPLKCSCTRGDTRIVSESSDEGTASNDSPL